ncbi:MAG TPA: serine--tRNA ligase, partial [Spirochaetota bacterium]|nr:serine--tRNA ligase [Spirochaetota bacterium]
MIDPKIVRDNIDLVKHTLKIRRMEDAVDIAKLEDMDATRRQIIAKIDELRTMRNTLSKEVGTLKQKGQNPTDIMEKVRSIGNDIKQYEEQIASIEETYTTMMLSIPNMLHESVPIGNDEHDNVVVRTWGQKPYFDFEPKPHYDLGTQLNILDFERGVKIAGARFYVYRGLAAQLER